MNLALSATLAFAAGVAIVVGASALESRPAATTSPVATSATPDARNVPNWKACLVREAGSLEKAFHAMNTIVAESNVFNRCLPYEKAIIATMDPNRTEDRNQTLARGMMMAEIVMDIREEKARKAGTR